MELSQVLQALRNADAAGDVEAARRLAQIAKEMMQAAPPASPQAAPAAPESGLLASAIKGGKQMLSSGQTALESLLGSDPEAAARAGIARGEELNKQYASEVSLDKLKKVYEQQGLLPAAGEALRQVPYAISEQAPNIGATLASARLGAAAGSPFGAPGALIGGIAGAALPSLFTQAGSNIERQAQERKPVDVGAAYGAAVPQAALDVAGTLIPLGRTLVGKALGPNVSALLERGAAESAEALAKESLLKVLAKGTAIGAIAEVPTEVTQQMLERYQAGLPLLSPDALKEYGETAYQTTLLAPIGAAGRVASRGDARRIVEEREQVKQGEELLKQRKAEAEAAAAEEAKKLTPEYALDFAKQHEALQAEYDDLGAQLKQKLPPGSSFAQKQTFEDLKKRRGELKELLSEQASEYNRLRPIFQPIRDQEAAAKQAEEAAQKAAADAAAQQAAAEQQARMGEEQFAGPMQQQVIPGITALPELAPAITPTVSLPEIASQRQKLMMLIDQNIDAQAQATAANNIEALAPLEKEYGQLQDAKTELESQIEKLGVKLPEVMAEERDALMAQREKKQAALQRMAQRHADQIEQFSPEKAQKLRSEIADITTQLEQYGVAQQPSPQMGLDMDVFPLKRGETKPEFAARVYKPGAEAVEAEEQAYLEEQRRAEEQARAEAEREQKIAPEAAALQRMAQRPLPASRFNFSYEVNQLLGKMEAATGEKQNRAFTGMVQQLQAATETKQLDRINKLIEDTESRQSTPQNQTRLQNLQKTKTTLEKALYRRLFDLAEQSGQGELLQRVEKESLAPTGEAKPRVATSPADFQARQDLYEQLLRTAKTPEERKQAAQKAFGATPEELAKLTGERKPLQLFGEAAPAAREVTRDELQERLTRALASNRLSDDAYDFLRRVESTLPEQDQDGYYARLNAQLERIESGAEGMAREGAGRTIKLKAFPAEGRADVAGATSANAEDMARQSLYQQKVADGMKPMQAREVAFKATREELAAAAEAENPALARTIREGQAPVEKRKPDVTGRTIRGPSAKALPLSMQEELEPFVQRAERARDEAEGQMALFPEEQAKVATERTTPGKFQRFLESKEADRLRKSVESDAVKLDRARTRLNALNDKIADLNALIADIDAAQADGAPAKKVKALKKELAQLEERERNYGAASLGAPGITDRIAAIREYLKTAEAAQTKLDAAYKKFKDVRPETLKQELDAVSAEFGSVLEAVAREGRLRQAVEELRIPRDQAAAFVDKFNLSAEDKALLKEQLTANANQTNIGKHFVALQKQLDQVQAALSRVDAVARVTDAEIRAYKYESQENVDRAALAVAKKELREARKEALKLTRQISAAEGKAATEAAAKRRAGQALNRAEQRLQATEKFKAEQAALERAQKAPEGVDTMGQPLRAVVYDPITDAERAAREDATPTILAAEMRQIRGNPTQVLKGYRAYITTITKKLREAYETARTQTREGVKEKAPYEAALRAYRDAKTSQARANIEPRLAKLEKAYNDAVTNALNARVMPKGLVGYQTALTEMLRKEAWLSDLIDKGKVEVAEPPKPRKRLTEAELAEIDAVLREKDIAEAVERVGAPELDVTQKTKTEIEKERKGTKTRYSSKGVGQETAIKQGKELEDLLKARKERQILMKKKPTAEEKARIAELEILERALEKVAKKEPLTELEQLMLDEYRRSRKPIKESEVERQKREEAEGADVSTEELAEAEQADFDAEGIAEGVNTGVEELDAMFDKPAGEETLEQLAARSSQGPALKEEVDVEESAAAVANNIAKNGSTELNRAVAERLKMLLGATRMELVKDLRDEDGQPAYGQAAADGSFIRLDSKFGLNEQTFLHEGVHAAVERSLRLPEDKLTEQQRQAKRELEELFAAYKKLPNASNENAKTSLSEFVADALSDARMQAEMRAEKWTLKNMWQSFKSAILNMLGVKTPSNMLEATLAAADALMTRVPRATAADTAILGPKVLNRPRGLNSAFNEADELSRKVVAGQRTWMQRTRANATGLNFETSLIDRFAGFERLAKYMPKLQGTQMMYYLRMYDQRMNFVAQSAANGALQLKEIKRKDGQTEYLIESGSGPSLNTVVSTLKQATPIVGNGDAVSRLFTLYLVANRAKRVGFDKLDISGKLTEAQLNAAVKQIESNAKLKQVFENARDLYNQYNEGLIRFAQKTGVFSEKQADTLLKSKDYIPWYRERNGVAELFIGGETPFKLGNIKDMPHLQSLVGGDSPILDFMVSSVQNTNMLVDMSLNNLATRNAVLELVDIGAAKITPKPISGPDVVRFKHKGEDRYAILDTERITVGGKTVDTGVPADLLVKGMQGIPVQLTGLMRMMALPTQLLRRAVTLSPLYMARQVVRDSTQAAMASGADIVPVLSALKEIGSATKGTLERRGITGGQVFTGTTEDITAIMRRIANGDNAALKLIGGMEAMGMEADALTRRAQYNSYIRQGLSEMEATLMALESMNFNKRGASPSVHFANSLYPFFNAQIQGLNALYKAMMGQASAQEKARIKQKLIVRGSMMMAAALAYAHAMQDDEAYKNALPADKYSNWFLRLSGVDEPVRIPIPFELGYIFKALPEAMYNTIVNEHGKEEAAKAFWHILQNTIPGGSSYFIPQIFKPGIEVGTNYSFFTGRDIVSSKEQMLLPEDQYRESTTELVKIFGGATGMSPIKIEALIRGYTGSMGLALIGLASMPFVRTDTPEKATKRLSDMPVIGGMFQPNDARWIINNTNDQLKDAQQVQASFKARVEKGDRAGALALINERTNDYARAELAGYYRQQMGELNKAETAVKASDMTPEKKREMITQIQQYRIQLSKLVRNASDASKLMEP